MNEIQIFNNSEFGQVRALEIDGAPWFVGKDVAEALEDLLKEAQNNERL